MSRRARLAAVTSDHVCPAARLRLGSHGHGLSGPPLHPQAQAATLTVSSSSLQVEVRRHGGPGRRRSSTAVTVTVTD
jgi:hypothetical protein